MKTIQKKYIDNSSFMEFIDEISTQITEMNFGADTYITEETFEGGYETVMTEESQDYYNETYDNYESLVNNIMGVYSNNELKK
tara:strand:+ start:858 stop:1106 length:249 start_codon:yes stop_codon:yes gene_type:complete